MRGIFNKEKAGFTLLELLVVLVIIGILSTLSITNYTKTRERAKDREAQTALSLIQSAERMLRLRSAAYYPSIGTEGDIGNINTNLKLNLGEQGWDYSVTGGASTFIACAQRSVGGVTRSWSINQDASEASPSGSPCP